jgi:hypothetical protein
MAFLSLGQARANNPTTPMSMVMPFVAGLSQDFTTILEIIGQTYISDPSTKSQSPVNVIFDHARTTFKLGEWFKALPCRANADN